MTFLSRLNFALTVFLPAAALLTSSAGFAADNGSIKIDAQGVSVTGQLFANSRAYINVFVDQTVASNSCENRTLLMHYAFDVAPNDKKYKYLVQPLNPNEPNGFESFFYPSIEGNTDADIRSVDLWFTCMDGGVLAKSQVYSIDLLPKPKPSEKILVTCDNGALEVIETNSPVDGISIRAEVNDPVITKFFVDESEKTETVFDSYFNRSVTIKKSFNWTVTVAGEKLTIVDFNTDSNSESRKGFLGAQYHPTLTPFGTGMDLFMDGSTMLSSHSAARYVIGNWFFQQCEYH